MNLLKSECFLISVTLLCRQSSSSCRGVGLSLTSVGAGVVARGVEFIVVIAIALLHIYTQSFHEKTTFNNYFKVGLQDGQPNFIIKQPCLFSLVKLKLIDGLCEIFSCLSANLSCCFVFMCVYIYLCFVLYT